MAQVTVEQLAETVGASVDRLLSQMKDAGLPHASADEAVSEEDKQTLLAHLKKSHGERAGAPKKITLKRKSVSTLRAGGQVSGQSTSRSARSEPMSSERIQKLPSQRPKLAPTRLRKWRIRSPRLNRFSLK